MTQPPRTTETINRDNAAIRDIMHQIRALTVPDRATLALGLVGHLATMMNRGQMSKLMSELELEVERVQDVPPARQREERGEDVEEAREDGAERGRDDRAAREGRSDDRVQAHEGVGQAGRGEFTSGRLV